MKMRIKLLLLAISIAFTSKSVNAQVPTYVPTNGLVAYYPFNGNANDASGNGNNGIVNSATLVNDRFGNSNSAYNFDGLSNSINCGTATSLITPSIFTYSVWINNIDNVSTAQKFVISNYNGGLRGNLLISQNSSIGDFRIHDGTNQKDAFSNIAYNVNSWYHLVAVKDNTSIKIYINNILAQVTDITNFNYLTNTNTPFTIGKAGWSNAGYFKGKIDDVGVWNRVLTQQEISNLYTGNTNITNSQCWQNISAGSFHNLAIKSDNTLWTWGFNQYGQLGDNTILDKTLPIQIGTDTDWSKISGGLMHSLSVKSNGTLWAWGDNSYGQLGDGTNSNKIYPIQIGTSNQWKTISSNFYSSYAIKTDGTLWAWGDNSYGQLGDGTNINKSSPIQINNSTNWKSISAGVNHASAIKNDGSLWAWGWNQWHQLGNGSTNDSNIPIQIGTDYNWKSVTCGNGYTIAIKTDGTIWSWGYNAVGECGYLVNTINNIPHQIGTDSDWKDVNTCYRHTIAIKNNGSLYAWGFNQHGQLGDNTTNDANHPILIGTDIDWQSISIGNSSSFSIKTNNSLWSWGNNQTGQLGDGSIIDKTSPIQINCNLLSNNYFSNLYTNLINIYPNPTNSKINIDCSNESNLIGSQIKITNTLGQEIYHSILNRPIYEIPLGSIATSGLYFVSIIDNDGKIITTKKIILQ